MLKGALQAATNRVNTTTPTDNRKRTRCAGAVIGLLLPTFITWVYFIHAAQYNETVQQFVGVTTKCLQFSFPLVWVGLALREPLGWPRPNRRGIVTGFACGLVVVAAGWLLYHEVLRESA